jgi:hypothetical protein
MITSSVCASVEHHRQRRGLALELDHPPRIVLNDLNRSSHLSESHLIEPKAANKPRVESCPLEDAKRSPRASYFGQPVCGRAGVSRSAFW